MRSSFSAPPISAALASLVAIAGCGANLSVVQPQFPNAATATASLRAGAAAAGCTPYDSVGGQGESVHVALDCPAQETTVVLMTIEGRLVAACEALDEEECAALVSQIEGHGASGAAVGSGT
jgi:hypothetical protein